MSFKVNILIFPTQWDMISLTEWCWSTQTVSMIDETKTHGRSAGCAQGSIGTFSPWEEIRAVLEWILSRQPYTKETIVHQHHLVSCTDLMMLCLAIKQCSKALSICILYLQKKREQLVQTPAPPSEHESIKIYKTLRWGGNKALIDTVLKLYVQKYSLMPFSLLGSVPDS